MGLLKDSLPSVILSSLLSIFGPTASQELQIELGDETCENYVFSPDLTPEDREVFDRISKGYIRHLYDCDDMAQCFRDYLIDTKKVDPVNIRLPIVMSRDGEEREHAFLQWHRGLEWRIFDPAYHIFNGPQDCHRKEYFVERLAKGDEVLIDFGGYLARGDTYNNGHWKTSSKKSMWNIPYRINQLLENDETRKIVTTIADLSNLLK